MVNTCFAVTAVLGVLLPLLPTRNERTERRLFWIGVMITTVSGFLVLYPPDAGAGLALGAGLGAVMVLRAFLNTSYIRIGGRTIAAKKHRRDGHR